MPNKSSPHGAAVSEGTVSCGTLRTQDLLRSFADTLSTVMPFNGRALADEAREAADALDRHDDSDATREAAGEVLECLTAQLETIAEREGMYFGALEGDGADFGFWRIVEDDAS